MTRRGKIARLPSALRDELNQRIEDGEEGVRLVEWLNGRDDVQVVLSTYFEGRPINEQNLSDWKAGGLKEWQQRQDAFMLASDIMEEAADRKELAGESKLSDKVGEMAALSLARMLRAMTRMEEGTEQRQTTLKVVREVVRLRHSDRAYEEAQRRKETHEHQAGQAWLRAQAGMETPTEKLHQLITRQLSAEGRRSEDGAGRNGTPPAQG